ncbi:MAG TPA: 50S ribosomal protein L6 [Thermoanaerobaculia bacterium]|nr:50S ribosomal protein L6 [Thermoanaerobaculia bacterium]
MSRIGKMPVAIPKGVEVKAESERVCVKGPKGELVSAIPSGLSVAVADGQVKIARANDEPHTRACHGLLRSLVANSVEGVTKGFTRELEISGVGYKAEVKGKSVVFSLGYSHPVDFPIPEGIAVAVDAKAGKLTVTGADKQKVGQTAAEIRKLRVPDPYKAKGIKYSNEIIKRKVGKAGGK